MNINRDVPTPFAVQIEPAEGCSLACSFCGIQSIRANGADADLGVHGKNSAPYRFLEERTLAKFAKESADAGWNPRWEFAMHGEPTMHPDLAGLVAAVRNFHPRGYIMITSNGSGLLKDAPTKIGALFNAGVNTLALDDYKHSGGWVGKIKEQLTREFITKYDIKPYRYPRDAEGNPHQRHNKRKLVIINDISENDTGTHQLTNQGGNSFAKGSSLEERCAKPFREFSIRWDGNVALCCDDWRGEYKIGNVKDKKPDELWYSEAFEAARRKLYAKDRAFGPCKGCDVRTLRNGLLPDKLGKGEMAASDLESNEVIKRALRGKVFTIKLGKGD